MKNLNITKLKKMYFKDDMTLKEIGRYLLPEEEVNHIDFNKQNNIVGNLHLFPTRGEHMKYHYMLKTFVNEALAGGV